MKLKHYLSIASLLSSLLGGATLSAQPSTLVIPAAGHLDGAGGTAFRSDIAIHNLRDVSQRVELRWLPRSGSGQVSDTKVIVIQARSVAESEDFVFGALSKEGLGAIVVRPVTADGAFDEAGKIRLASRIWTQTPGVDGTASQSFPTITYGDLTESKRTIYGLRRDTRYRLNVGIVNLDNSTRHRFRISTYSKIDGIPPEVTEVEIDPSSMQQVALPGGPLGSMRIVVEALPIQGGGLLTLFAVYGSSVDNVTGDGWSHLGVAD